MFTSNELTSLLALYVRFDIFVRLQSGTWAIHVGCAKIRGGPLSSVIIVFYFEPYEIKLLAATQTNQLLRKFLFDLSLVVLVEFLGSVLKPIFYLLLHLFPKRLNEFCNFRVVWLPRCVVSYLEWLLSHLLAPSVVLFKLCLDETRCFRRIQVNFKDNWLCHGLRLDANYSLRLQA